MFLYISKKIPWENYVRFWKWNLKYTSKHILVGTKLVFEKIKFKALHYIQHDLIRWRLGLSKDNTFWWRQYLIKGGKYFFFKKVGAANFLLKLNYLISNIFNIWSLLFIFFLKWQRQCKVLCLISCNHERKNSHFCYGKTSLYH